MAGPKLVRTLIYSFAALVVLIVFLKSSRPESSSASAPAVAKPAQALVEDLIEVDVNAPYDPAVDLHNILNQRPYSPVVIFSKSYCGFSKKAKTILLDKYSISPEPHVVELDLHEHGPELQAHLHSVTGRRTVPNVLVLGKSHGGGDDMEQLHSSGKLIDAFENWAEGNLKVTKK